MMNVMSRKGKGEKMDGELITIRTSAGTREIPAVVVGDYAIHPLALVKGLSRTKKRSVTYVPSGCVIVNFDTEKKAREFVSKLIERGVDLSVSASIECYADRQQQMPEGLRELIKECAGFYDTSQPVLDCKL